MGATLRSVPRLPSRRAALIVALLVVLTAAVLHTALAYAGTANWCSSCTEKIMVVKPDPNGYYITGEYNHYLGTGTRLIAAGAAGLGTWATGYNEVFHAYAGNTWTNGEVLNESDHDITANAHTDFV